jgi:uncharacterized protein
LLNYAQLMNEYTLQHFYDTNSGMYYFTSDLDEEIITRQFEIPDQVTPSSNSIMAANLFLLGTLFENQEYIDMAKKMLSNIQGNLTSLGTYFANWAIVYILFVESPFEIAIVGNNCIELNRKLHSHFIPNVIVVGNITGGTLPLLQNKLVKNQTNIYVCKDKTCSLPTTDLNDALKMLKNSKK